jgi:hypothetical protein
MEFPATATPQNYRRPVSGVSASAVLWRATLSAHSWRLPRKFGLQETFGFTKEAIGFADLEGFFTGKSRALHKSG